MTAANQDAKVEDIAGLGRGAPGERSDAVEETSGTDERLMRNQFRAWAKWMGEGA